MLDILQTYFFAIVKAEAAAYAKPVPVELVATAPQVAIAPLPISEQTTGVMPAVTPNYPSAQMPAINAGDLPTLTFDLGGQQS